MKMMEFDSDFNLAQNWYFNLSNYSLQKVLVVYEIQISLKLCSIVAVARASSLNAIIKLSHYLNHNFLKHCLQFSFYFHLQVYLRPQPFLSSVFFERFLLQDSLFRQIHFYYCYLQLRQQLLKMYYQVYQMFQGENCYLMHKPYYFIMLENFSMSLKRDELIHLSQVAES